MKLLLVIVLVASALAGCVVAPVYPGYSYGYDRYGYGYPYAYPGYPYRYGYYRHGYYWRQSP